jgi:Raf kinase inhibitor-like YbhB/YbcL family protein
MFRIAIATVIAFLAVAADLEAKETFKVTSPDIKDGRSLSIEQVFNGFGCTGKNVSPVLKWAGAPKGTKSFAVTVYDPDAPTGSGWWHWVVFNIPANVHALPKNAGNPAVGLAPKGSVQVRTDFGKPGFGGACPPVGHGVHRYQFTVYALDVPKLDLDNNATPALVGFMINAHKLAKARIEAVYSRKGK